jgi:hypothetical protein
MTNEEIDVMFDEAQERVTEMLQKIRELAKRGESSLSAQVCQTSGNGKKPKICIAIGTERFAVLLSSMIGLYGQCIEDLGQLPTVYMSNDHIQ